MQFRDKIYETYAPEDAAKYSKQYASAKVVSDILASEVADTKSIVRITVHTKDSSDRTWSVDFNKNDID